jgi:hypothetical protein
MPGSRYEMNPKREIFLNKYSNIADAFNRLRVSDPTALFAHMQYYEFSAHNFFKQASTSATVTHNTSSASVKLEVTDASVSAIMQTRAYWSYEPGRSQVAMLTFGGFDAEQYVNKRVGYFDALNGIFFEANADGSSYNFVRRSGVSGSAVDTKVEQAEWNIDKMDGNGPGRYTLDFSKVQIAFIDLEWLGVGRVRCGFVVDGTIMYAHEFLQANIGTEVYMQTPSLPLRYEIESTTSFSGTANYDSICMAVLSEGGVHEEEGEPFAASNGAVLVACAQNIRKPLLAIRPRLTTPSTSGGKPNRKVLLVQGFEVFAQDNDTYYELVWGGTVTGLSSDWQDVHDESSVEYTKLCTGMTGGVVIDAGYIPAARANGGSSEKHAITGHAHLALDIAGAHPTTTVDTYTDQLALVVTPFAGASDCGAVINWQEVG